MEFRRLPAEEARVRRYVRTLWLPYQRDLERAVDDFALVDAPADEIVKAETAFRLDRLEEADYRLWVAVGGSGGGSGGGNDEHLETGGEFVGFVATELDESPPVFDRPDRLLVCDLYVRESHRGTGLARDLVDRAARRAREAGCPELALDVDVDNGRALAFYETVGFEPVRRRMTVAVEDV
jgi:ribosomal protein S18 acetylase RimI-like enzyme